MVLIDTDLHISLPEMWPQTPLNADVHMLNCNPEAIGSYQPTRWGFPDEGLDSYPDSILTHTHTHLRNIHRLMKTVCVERELQRQGDKHW